MESRINHIIAHVLSGEASSDDILTLSRWLGENPENQEEFHRLKSYWDAEVAFSQSVAASLAAEKLQQTIQKQSFGTKKISLGRAFILIAASVALLIVLTVVGVMNYTGHMSTEYYTYLTDEHKSSFTMEDGTVVTLNKNSRLLFTDAFGKRKRSVKLEGEAYFEVAKNTSKPFQVELGDASITVLGTHFNVKADPESDKITTTLVEGSIRFEGAKQHIVMTPNQQLTFSRLTNKIDIKHVDADIFIAWKNGLLKYKTIPFIELISELEKIYKVSIKLENKELAEPYMTVSGTFSKDQNIEEILKVISRSLPIHWNNSNGIYYIHLHRMSGPHH